MILHRLGLINRNQRGFTLMELMLAIAISGIIAGSITAAIFQVVVSSARTNNHMTVVGQAENAGYWVSRDAQMAQTVVLADESVDDPDGTRFPLTLTWTDWDSNDEHQVVYTLVDMPSGGLKNLQRNHYINGTLETDIIAQFIDPNPEKTNCYLYKCLICDERFASLVELEEHFALVHPSEELQYESGVLAFTVTATVGTGSQEQSETRVYEAKPRPGSW